jgi:hypothetical protein
VTGETMYRNAWFKVSYDEKVYYNSMDTLFSEYSSTLKDYTSPIKVCTKKKGKKIAF